MAKTAIIYWLIPARAERELFRRLIRILAHELEAPVFSPHLTLFSTSQDCRSAKASLRAFKAMPLSLPIRDVQFSTTFTKTLFVRFRPNAALDRLAAGMQCGAGRAPAGISDPHLSLCYKKLPGQTTRELASAIKLPLREVMFDCVQAVVGANPTRTADEVRAWRVIGRKLLSK